LRNQLPGAAAISRLRSLIALLATAVVGWLLIFPVVHLFARTSNLFAFACYLSIWAAVMIYFMGGVMFGPRSRRWNLWILMAIGLVLGFLGGAFLPGSSAIVGGALLGPWLGVAAHVVRQWQDS
jgi:hypothetical protein